MYYNDLEIEHRVFGVELIKIAWLDNTNVFNVGSCPQSFIDKLKTFKPNIASHGYHDCPFCDEAKSSCRYTFQIPGTLKYYDTPDMIIHYIEKHNYLPPQEFIDFILNL